MNNIKKFALTAVSAAVLVGCGGGGGSSAGGTAQTIQGKAIDGYIVGADVFLDLNFNGIKEANEPSTVTKDEGDFAIPINPVIEKCAQYVPVVVHVPVGAIDLDTPDTPIDEAYTMVIPPAFAMPTDHDLINLTPLTTVIWSEVERAIRENTSNELSCESITNEIALREEIAEQVRSQSLRFAGHYNVTVDDMFGDYVESGDTDLYNAARALVPSLKASFRETREIVELYPDAVEAWIEYFYGLNSQLYRTEMLSMAYGNFTSTTHLASDFGDYSEVYQHDTQNTVERDGLSINYMLSVQRYEDDSSYAGQYACTRYEEVRTNQAGEMNYGIINAVSASPTSIDNCMNLTDGSISQSKTYYQEKLSGIEIQQGEFSYDENNPLLNRDLIGITDTITASDVIGFAGGIDTYFRSEESHSSDFWFRLKSEFYGGKQVMTKHNSRSEWKRTTYEADGTQSTVCGDSEYTMSHSGCNE